MVLAARFPDVERARKRIDEADRKIREALEMGQTWHNTPWPNYQVIIDEKGMAVDVVEVEGDMGADDDEIELRKIWARFETQEATSSPASKLCSDLVDHGTTRPRGRPKRKYREDVDNIPLDSNQRRKIETCTSASPLLAGTNSPSTTPKSCTLRVQNDKTPVGRRPGLRSANTARNR
jgi:hypothetical protein